MKGNIISKIYDVLKVSNLRWSRYSDNRYIGKNQYGDIKSFINERIYSGMLSKDIKSLSIIFVTIFGIPLIGNFGSYDIKLFILLFIMYFVYFEVIHVSISRNEDQTPIVGVRSFMSEYKKYLSHKIILEIVDRDDSGIKLADKPLLSSIWLTIVTSDILDNRIEINLKTRSEEINYLSSRSVDINTLKCTNENPLLENKFVSTYMRLNEYIEVDSSYTEGKLVLVLDKLISMENQIMDTILILESKDYNKLTGQDKEIYEKVINATLDVINETLDNIDESLDGSPLYDDILSVELEYLKRLRNKDYSNR